MILQGFVCNGPRCDKGSFGKPTVVQWDGSNADPNAMPDEFFRFIIVRSVYEEPSPHSQSQQPPEHHFCSSGCLRDFYNEQRYTPPRSPREQAAQAANNAEVAAKNTAGSVDGYGKPQVLASKVIPFRKPAHSGPPVDQADGAGNDSGPVS